MHGVPFTSETARIAARKSNDAQRERKLRALEALVAEPDRAEPSAYLQRQIVIARAHLDKLDKLIALTNDPLSLDRLMRAAAVAAERERIVSGRPLPGKAQAAAKIETKPGRVIEPE